MSYISLLFDSSLAQWRAGPRIVDSCEFHGSTVREVCSITLLQAFATTSVLEQISQLTHFLPLHSIVLRTWHGRTMFKQQCNRFLQFDFSPSWMVYLRWWVGSLGVKIINRHGACVIQFLQCAYTCDYSNAFFFDLILVLHSNGLTKTTGSELKKHRKTGIRLVKLHQKRKGQDSIRNCYRIRWLGGCCFLFCLNCCYFPLLVIDILLVWVKLFLSTF